MISELKHSDKIIDLAIGLKLISGRGSFVNNTVNKYLTETAMPVKLNQITSYILKSVHSPDTMSQGVKDG